MMNFYFQDCFINSKFYTNTNTRSKIKKKSTTKWHIRIGILVVQQTTTFWQRTQLKSPNYYIFRCATLLLTHVIKLIIDNSVQVAGSDSESVS